VGDADNRSIRIQEFGEEILPTGGMINGIITDENIMTRFFSEMNGKYGLSRGTTLLVLDSNNIQTKILDVPAVADARVIEFIKRSFSQYNDDEEDDAVYDFTVLNPRAESGGVSVLAVSVAQQMIRSYKSVLIGAGCDLKGINVGVNAQIKLAKFLPQLQTGTFIFVQIDGRNLSVSLFEDGNFRIVNKNRMVQTENSPEWYTEIGNNLSSMLQFSKSQRSNIQITAAYIAGLQTDQIAYLAQGITYLGIDIRELSLTESIRLEGSAAQKGAYFNPGKYLLNLGNLLKK
jgi:hypothetical protein